MMNEGDATWNVKDSFIRDTSKHMKRKVEEQKIFQHVQKTISEEKEFFLCKNF